MTDIVIVGSLNMDFVVQVSNLPARGETVRGRDLQMLPGGKGANQACAVGRLGGEGRMIGRVGEDAFGAQLKAGLQADGIDVTGIWSTPGLPTGIALIAVEASGQNTIVVSAGANAALQPREVEQAIDEAAAGFLLLQLESPLETVAAAAARAKARGMTVILDPAPAQTLPSSLLDMTDLLTPNESEARALLGLGGDSICLADAPSIAARLLDTGPRGVILKLAEKGAWLADRNQSLHLPAFSVSAVDATGAGDCFNGALAVSLAEGSPLTDAIRFASCAAALAATHSGAQSSIPLRAEVEKMVSPPA